LNTKLSIAVIIPVLNEQSALPSLIERLRGLPLAEFVLVDGGSHDGSTDILNKAGVRWLGSGKGRAAQMNAGAAACCSDVLLFMHSDTLIDSPSVAAIERALQVKGVVGGRFDVQLSGAHPAFRLIEWMINWRSRLSGISTGDQCQFVRRSVFEAMGGFAVLPLMEDVDFSRRLKRMGTIASLSERVITSSRRWEQHGIVRTILLMWRLRLQYFFGVPAERLAAIYREAR